MKSTALPRNLADWLARQPKGKAPRRRIPRVTKKRAKLNKEYTQKRREFLWRNRCCEILVEGCTITATDVHHSLGRGPHLNNVESFVATCRHCHNYVHSHPSWARQNGYLK